MKVFKVTVRCTNYSKNTFSVEKTSPTSLFNRDFDYYDCSGGVIYVATECPIKIYEKFKDAVISIEDIGVGYYL